MEDDERLASVTGPRRGFLVCILGPYILQVAR
jgi:hypothetical protein